MVGRILKITTATVVGLTIHNILPLIVRALELERMIEDNPEMFIGSIASAVIEEMIEEMKRLGELPDLLAEAGRQHSADLTDDLGDGGAYSGRTGGSRDPLYSL